MNMISSPSFSSSEKKPKKSFLSSFQRRSICSSTNSQRKTGKSSSASANNKTNNSPSPLQNTTTATTISSSPSAASAAANIPDLPLTVWLSHVFPFLDRKGQDVMVQVHREIWLARRRGGMCAFGWPTGTISPQFSRPVKSLAFVGGGGVGGGNNNTKSITNNNTTNKESLWVSYCKDKVQQIDKIRGPIDKIHNSNHNNNKPQKNMLGSMMGKNLIATICCSPVDSSIVATAGERDGLIKLWKLQQQQPADQSDEEDDANNKRWICYRIITVYQHQLRHMIWSPQGDKIATWGREGLLQISNVSTGDCVGTHWKTRLEVSGCHQTVCFTPNSKSLLFALNNDFVFQWDFYWQQQQQQQQQQRHHQPASRPILLPELNDTYGSHRGTYITSLAFSPNGKYLVAGCHVSLIKIWHVIEVTTTTQQEEEGEQGEEEGGATTTPNNRRRTRSSSSYQYIYNKEIHLGSGWSAVTLLTFSPDGKLLVCTNDGSQIRIVDWNNQDNDNQEESEPVLATLQGQHKGRIESLCFSKDGKTLASGSCDRTVRLWDMERFYGVTT